MYTEYANEIIDEDALLYEQPSRATDIPLPPMINILLLVVWLAICLLGFAVIFLGKNPLLGVIIAGIPTFLGMIIKPSFALCVFMLVLPTSAGVGIEESFTLGKGVGIALAIAFAINLIITRPSLKIRNKALWILVAYVFWVFVSSLIAPYPGLEISHALTHLQLLVLAFIAYWIIETNDEKTLHWVLRSYVVGMLGMIITTFITGAAIRSMTDVSEEERYGATLGRVINQNLLGALVALAFLAAIYLIIRDKKIFWRIIYVIAIGFLPVMLLRIASRGALIALTFTMLSPLLFIRQIWRKPVLALLMLGIVIFASGSAAFILKGGETLRPPVYKRLTDPEEARGAIRYRMSLNMAAIRASLKRPLGASKFAWFETSGVRHHPHNDFFRALGFNGIPAAALFVTLMIMMMLTVKRMPIGVEKLYARAILTFLLVMGLGMSQLTMKHLWVFLAIIMAIERISWLRSGITEY